MGYSRIFLINAPKSCADIFLTPTSQTSNIKNINIDNVYFGERSRGLSYIKEMAQSKGIGLVIDENILTKVYRKAVLDKLVGIKVYSIQELNIDNSQLPFKVSGVLLHINSDPNILAQHIIGDLNPFLVYGHLVKKLDKWEEIVLVRSDSGLMPESDLLYNMLILETLAPIKINLDLTGEELFFYLNHHKSQLRKYLVSKQAQL